MVEDCPSPVRLGTRGSALALAQEALARTALERAQPGISVTRKIIRTTGDRRSEGALPDSAISGPQDKGEFIRELETALTRGEIDIAVHSLKDVPAELPRDFKLAAFLPRAPVQDVLLSRVPLADGLASLPPGARIGTCSLRRGRQLLSRRSDLHIEDIRGNVPTRIAKLFAPGGPYAIVLAIAGLIRLGWIEPGSRQSQSEHGIVHMIEMDPNEFLPSAGQGAVTLEIRADDQRFARLLSAIDHRETRLRVTLERRFLQLLGAGCRTPVGIHTSLTGSTLRARACIFPEDDPTAPAAWAEAEGPSTEPESIALDLQSQLRPRSPA